MRILLVTHEHLIESDRRSQPNYVANLRRLAEVDVLLWEDLPSLDIRSAASVAGSPIADYDACLFFVRMRELLKHDAFDWTGFEGPRAWLEFDAVQNYWPCEIPLRGTFAELYHRQGFDLMLSTGKHTASMLRDDGVNAHWLPKGFSDVDFDDLRRERHGVCSFGRKWPSRQLLGHRLRRSGIALVDVSGPFTELNSRLNDHLAGVVCNMPSEFAGGRAGKLLNRLSPVPLFVRTWPAIEPMIKTFEVPAAGCALIVDPVDELADLGFEDGVNCLVYGDFDHAVEILRDASPEHLREIGRAGFDLVHASHTWRHRAQQSIDIIEAARRDR